MPSDREEKCARVPRAEIIARLNDAVRKTGRGGSIVVTRGVRGLPAYDADKVMRALAAYDQFSPENDPHGERDLGDLHLFGADLLWKIDYYDLAFQYGSEDPADAARTGRVLTVMLVEDY